MTDTRDKSGAAAGAESDFLARLFAAADIGIYETDGAGAPRRANPALARMFGYADAAAFAAVRPEMHYADAEDRARALERLAQDGAIHEALWQARRADGTLFWVRESAVRVDGPEPRHIGTLTEVTQLVDAWAQVQRAESNYRSMFENATHGIYRSTPEGKQLRANPALVRLNGYATEAEMLAAVNDIGAEWYVDPGRRDEFKRRIEADGRVWDFESEIHRHKTRERIWISESAWAVRGRDGRTLYYEGTVHDVTARKRGERALAEAKAETERLAEEYRSIFENATVGIYRTDAAWNVRAINPALARLNGFRRVEDQLAVHFRTGARETWYVTPGRRELFRETLAREGRVAAFESEVVRRADGARIWVSENAWAVRDATGKTIAYEGTVEDVTARKRAEASLREAKAEAEAASAAKSAFLAVMSHELRTPLNAIIGFAEIVEGKLFGPHDARYFEYAGHIRQSGTHLLTLINDILDLSKIGAGQFDLNETEVDLAALCEDAVRLFGASAAKAGVVLERAPDFPAVRIRADALRLRQVAMNLVSNAIKFTPRDGRVRVGGFAAADRAGFWVEDTGIGMTEAEAGRAMEPFVQIDDGLARKRGGTGLGLPISKELVALHGGRLILTSVKGQGTRVTVELPAGRAPGSPDPG